MPSKFKLFRSLTVGCHRWLTTDRAGLTPAQLLKATAPLWPKLPPGATTHEAHLRAQHSQLKLSIPQSRAARTPLPIPLLLPHRTIANSNSHLPHLQVPPSPSPSPSSCVHPTKPNPNHSNTRNERLLRPRSRNRAPVFRRQEHRERAAAAESDSRASAGIVEG